MKVLVVLLSIAIVATAAPQCKDVPEKDRYDCNPDSPINEEVCHKRGCCWTSAVMPLSPAKAPLSVPLCYFGPNYVGYEVKNIQNNGLKTVITLSRNISSGFPKDSKTVNLEITSLNDYSVRIKFYDPNQKRYEVPVPVLDMNSKKTVDKPQYKVNVDKNGTLEVVRIKTSKRIFKTDLKKLIFSDQFLQVISELPSDYVYGLGEHQDSFRKDAKKWKRYTMLNRDHSPIPNLNLYGSHPFYLSSEDSEGNSNGVFLFNSNAMDVILQPKPAITWRTIGGILDFYVFLGPQPKEVIKQYTKLIGFPQLPPYWAFGFQLCKYGYPKGIEGMMAVFNRTRKAGIPYDVQWNDIDAMDNHLDFTYDHKAFAKLPQFVSELHKVGMKYVPMFDPAIGASEKPGISPAYDLGLQMNIFIKNSSGKPYIGKVWPGNSAWPDFTDPKATDYWTKLFSDFHKTIEFDGSWIDMNEPSNFVDGSINGCPNTPLENPQYVPGAGNDDLRKLTMCMSGVQKAGLHYDLHNLYGFTEAIATNSALKTVLKKRPFIISRSTAPGHGKYAGHWDGDVVSSWEHMRWTVPSIMNMNMFGIPLVGADICGFGGNTNEELCSRWSALGAFYPFSRNHNGHHSIEQDPVALGPKVIAAAKTALQWKYSLLPNLYTLFYKAHTTGDTVIRPLFFEFPNDSKSYEIETQFMWGSSLMIVPTLQEKATYVNAYLPPGLWYDWKTHSHYQSKGEIHKLDSPLTEIKLFVRSGNVLVTQEPKVTTEETRKENFELLVALDNNGISEGSLYWDSGDGFDNPYDFIEFAVKNNSLTSEPKVTAYDISGQHLKKAVVLGVKSQPKSVVVNGVSTKNFKFNSANNELVIDNIGANLLKKNVIQWNL